MICAGQYEDILAIILFGVCENISFSKVGTSTEHPGIAAGWIILQVVAGIGIGIVIGLSSFVLNYIRHPTLRIWIKFLFCISVPAAVIA